MTKRDRERIDRSISFLKNNGYIVEKKLEFIKGNFYAVKENVNVSNRCFENEQIFMCVESGDHPNLDPKLITFNPHSCDEILFVEEDEVQYFEDITDKIYRKDLSTSDALNFIRSVFNGNRIYSSEL